jgi:hypothetical protein
MESGLFEGEEAVLHLIDRIVGPLGLRVDESSPYVDARLPDGSRFHDSFRAEPELYALEVDPGRRGLGLERPLDRGDGLRCGEGPYLVSSSGREQSPKADFRLRPTLRLTSESRQQHLHGPAPARREAGGLPAPPLHSVSDVLLRKQLPSLSSYCGEVTDDCWPKTCGGSMEGAMRLL